MNWEEKYNAVSELVDSYRRERDEARAEANRFQHKAIQYDLDRAGIESRAQDAVWFVEARAEVERVRKHYAASVLEHGKMLAEAVDSAKRQKSLADRAHDQACRLAAKLDARSTDQFRRGAEAMREACIGTACAQDLDPDAQDRMEECLRALPIPEEK